MKKICGSKKNQAGIEGGSGGVPEAPAVPLNHRSPSTGLKALSSVLWAVSGAPTSGEGGLRDRAAAGSPYSPGLPRELGEAENGIRGGALTKTASR